MDEFFANITRQIDMFGWSVLYVGGGSCDVPGCRGEHESDLVGLGLPPYGYTVGLPLRFDHPELVIVGLDQARTVLVLNEIAKAVSTGTRLDPGDLLEMWTMPACLARAESNLRSTGSVSAQLLGRRAVLRDPGPSTTVRSQREG